MTDMTMRERLLHAALTCGADPQDECNYTREIQKVIDAILAEIREPDEAMRARGAMHTDQAHMAEGDDEAEAAEVFIAMIEAIK